MRKVYYIPFVPTANVNYTYILSLFDLAYYRVLEDNDGNKSKAFDLVPYFTIKELAERAGLTASTLKRIIADDRYRFFFTHNKTQKILILNNRFKKGVKKQQFVVLTEQEYKVLMTQKDSFLIRYFIYIKYYCGYTKSQTTDFTAKQYLSAVGYSVNSNANLSKVASCNSFLVSAGLIEIKKFRDTSGNERNLYSLPIAKSV